MLRVSTEMQRHKGHVKGSCACKAQAGKRVCCCGEQGALHTKVCCLLYWLAGHPRSSSLPASSDFHNLVTMLTPPHGQGNTEAHTPQENASYNVVIRLLPFPPSHIARQSQELTSRAGSAGNVVLGGYGWVSTASWMAISGVM